MTNTFKRRTIARCNMCQRLSVENIEFSNGSPIGINRKCRIDGGSLDDICKYFTMEEVILFETALYNEEVKNGNKPKVEDNYIVYTKDGIVGNMSKTLTIEDKLIKHKNRMNNSMLAMFYGCNYVDGKEVNLGIVENMTKEEAVECAKTIVEKTNCKAEVYKLVSVVDIATSKTSVSGDLNED